MIFSCFPTWHTKVTSFCSADAKHTTKNPPTVRSNTTLTNRCEDLTGTRQTGSTCRRLQNNKLSVQIRTIGLTVSEYPLYVLLCFVEMTVHHRFLLHKSTLYQTHAHVNTHTNTHPAVKNLVLRPHGTGTRSLCSSGSSSSPQSSRAGSAIGQCDTQSPAHCSLPARKNKHVSWGGRIKAGLCDGML